MNSLVVFQNELHDSELRAFFVKEIDDLKRTLSERQRGDSCILNNAEFVTAEYFVEICPGLHAIA